MAKTYRSKLSPSLVLASGDCDSGFGTTGLTLLIQKLSVWREIGDIVGMEYLLDRKGERRLAAYFHRIGKSCERRRNERRLPLTPWG